MQYVAIKGLDRGGTNALLSLFHYRPEFFSLTEKVQSRINKKNLREVPTEKLFKHSMFGGLDSKLKDYNNIRNMVFKMPRDAEFIDNVFRYKYYDFNYDKVIYLIRNPLRVYISQQNANKKRRCSIRNKWNYWNSIINQTATHIDEYNKLNNMKMITWEYFVKNLAKELPVLLRWVDDNAKVAGVGPEMGRDFWRACGICNSKLIKSRSKYLECPKCHKKIMGHGKFNPSTPFLYERTTQEDVRAFFVDKPEMICEVKRKFGKLLFDYWFYDVDHNYDKEIDKNLFQGAR